MILKEKIELLDFNPNDYKIETLNIDGYYHFSAFKISLVPRYDNTENDKEEFLNNLLRQKMFLDNIKTFLSKENGRSNSIELRFVSNPVTRTIYTYLVLKQFSLKKLDEKEYDMIVKSLIDSICYSPFFRPQNPLL